MNPNTAANAGPETLPPAQAAELEALLVEFIAHHERMIPLIAAHRAAISRADAPAIAAALAASHAAMARLADLETRRRKLTTAVMGPPVIPRLGTVAAKITLRMLAAKAAEPVRTRLMTLADRLKTLLTKVMEQQAAIERASAILLEHMNGLISQISRALSPTGLYSRPGEPARPMAISGLDLTS